MKRLASLLSAVVLVLAVAPAALAADEPTQTIVQIATANGNFKTLLAAVGCADPAIGRALTGKGPLTVFAPTDDAFAKAGLNPGNVCTALTRSKLNRILLYHVSPGTRMSGQVLPATWNSVRHIPTLNSQPIWALRVGTLFTPAGSSARILVQEGLFDIRATNGVIHVIDAVLLPRL